MTSAQRFTVIVVNYNGGEMMTNCAKSLLDAGLKPHQLIVIDNGSKDDSLTRLEQLAPDCAIIRLGCNAGFARAVNRGLAETKTDFALLLNNDARLLPGALDAMAAHFDAHPHAAFVGGQLLFEDGRLQNAVAPFPRLLTEALPKSLLKRLHPMRYNGKPQGDGPIEVESLIGALFAARMQAVRDFGPLDDDFFFFLEETEWCHRAHQRGWQVWHVPAARAVHAQGGTARRYNALARIEYQRSKLLYFAKTAPSLYPLAFTMLLLKAATNALANGLLLLLGGFASSRHRNRTRVYGQVLGWYLAGRPADVGLPDKCPKNQNPSPS